MKRLILPWTSVISWAIVAWIAFTIPGDKLPKTPGAWDRILGNGAHLTIFFILAGLLYNALNRTRDAEFRTVFLIVFLVSASYGTFTEICQELVPGRYPSVKDGFLNAFGALNFLALAWANRAGLLNFRRNGANIKKTQR